VEIEKLIAALEDAIRYLRVSGSSAWASMSVDEMIQALETELAKCRDSGRYDAHNLAFLFAPTGPLQEAAIDNGWGEEYLRISADIDQFTGNQ